MKLDWHNDMFGDKNRKALKRLRPYFRESLRNFDCINFLIQSVLSLSKAVQGANPFLMVARHKRAETGGKNEDY